MSRSGPAAVALLVLAAWCTVPAAQACPRSCNCYQANEVHCTFRSLLAVPHGLPAHTQRINLGFNSIRRIPESSLAGLKRAELLMLHGNDLRQIPDGVFGDMRSLQVLKLSYNKLTEISAAAFSGLTSLLRLHLDHNLLGHLHPRALLQLPSLRLLRMQGNRLHQLHPRSLCTLSLLNTYYYSTLRQVPTTRQMIRLHLDLSNNSLASLPEQALSTAPLLETVVLHANPWRCDCKMSWFLGWSLAHPGYDGRSGLVVVHNNSPDVPTPDLSLPDATPIPVAVSLALECPAERESYESLWRILAYYSETAVPPRALCYSKPQHWHNRYRQSAETEDTTTAGVKASVKATPHWMLQPAVSLQLNRAQSSAPYSATAGSRAELSCPVVSSGNLKLHWILPDGSKLIYPYSSADGRIQITDSGLLLQRSESLDTGLYYCVALAGSDVDVLPIRLAVEESSVVSTGEQAGPSVTGLVGEAVILPCNVSGSPTAEISWLLPDGNIVQHGKTVPSGVSVHSNGSLSMPQASLKDVGSYRCMAVNQYGTESLSMRLDVYPRARPPFRTSFHRGPQSAAGRSTRIRAPLLQDTVLEEGSGDNVEEENPEIPVVNRRRPQFPLNRRFPNGHPRRRGPIRGGKPIRKGVFPGPGRNRFDSRTRGGATKQRLDPQKWADLLAKIRQRTTLNSTSPPTEAEEPTLEPL
ncbi:LOW QUALITY PROTEIN: hypothetical protein CRUP_022416, partial [Coryphaenoides rupestris]